MLSASHDETEFPMAQPPALIIPKVAPKGRDIGFAIGIVGILAVLFLPIPAFSSTSASPSRSPSRC
jgi:flagellar biosynthesis protein FlhA